MDFDEFKKRLQAERSTRAQRDAAEKRIPGERLRREIREAFAREDARRDDDRQSDAQPDPRDGPDAQQGR